MPSRHTIHRGAQMPNVGSPQPPFAVDEPPRPSLELVLRLVISNVPAWAMNLVAASDDVSNIHLLDAIERNKWMRVTQAVSFLHIQLSVLTVVNMA